MALKMATITHIPFLSLRGMVAEYRNNFTNAFSAELDAGEFIQGNSVKEFEGEFATMLGVDEAIGVSNGLDALSLSLAALDIGGGDEVIVPTNSFIATALAVSSVGAKPVLVDCGLDHLIDPELASAAITSRTKAIIPVHLTGHPAAMDAILHLGERHNLAVIEDAAQAHGSRYQGIYCGALGQVGCFSFYPTKNLGALGDGGMVTCHDKSLARRIRRLANYGKQDRDTYIERGSNKRLDSLQAAFLRVLLSDLSNKNAKRTELSKHYWRSLAACSGLSLPIAHDGCDPVWHLYIVRHPNRDKLREALAADGVETLIHYRIPIHLQPAYRDLGYMAGDFPVAEKLANTMLSLPFHPWLDDAEISHIFESVHRFCEASCRSL
jgi:dTDP-4-amino-4,6-dideoxygalactose transaminase